MKLIEPQDAPIGATVLFYCDIIKRSIMTFDRYFIHYVLLYQRQINRRRQRSIIMLDYRAAYYWCWHNLRLLLWQLQESFAELRDRTLFYFRLNKLPKVLQVTLDSHIQHLLFDNKINATIIYNPDDAWAQRTLRRIAICPIVDAETYFTALHEIAHVVDGPSWYSRFVERECHAWNWAIDRSLIEIDTSVSRVIIKSIMGYVVYSLKDARTNFDKTIITKLLKRIE